jgi:hypothetical protein
MNVVGFAVVTSVKALSQYFFDRAEEKHGMHQSG